MIKVGLTGTIGSGKSTIAKVFENLNIPIFFADSEAKACYFDDEVKAKIIQLLGEDSYKSENKLNTEYISNKAFNNKELLAQLSNIIHPAVQERYQRFIKNNISSHYTIMEAAILHESGSYKNFDYIITVTAPIDIRVQRVIQRENCSEQEVLNRIDKQWSDEKKLNNSDFSIINDGQKPVIPQVLDIHNKLLQL
ncbi:MAG: dephospho-CoA kinase [Hyphomicrobiales bacterium]